MKLVFRGAIGVSACLLFVGAATGCSPSTDTASTPTVTVTDSEGSQSPSPNNSDEPACTAEALTAGMNGDGTIERFECASKSGTYWAAAEFKEPNGSVLEFYTARDGEWDDAAETNEKLCMDGSQLPQEILEEGYCAGVDPNK
ncbi:MAG: hypothetical protein ACJAY5_001944 [Actinomycetes bacterium]|jgi:hypothetical protein